ncbi:hypothetical protein ACFZBP_39980, partial [Streptomyces sp. NPDC008086]
MQGRFKRDGSASAEPEHGGTDRGPSTQHAQNQGGPALSVDGGERSGRPAVSASAGAVSPSAPAP